MKKFTIIAIALAATGFAGVASAGQDSAKRITISGGRSGQINVEAPRPERPMALTGQAAQGNDGPAVEVRNQGRSGFRLVQQNQD